MRMWRAPTRWTRTWRWFSSSAGRRRRHHLEDEGDWSYSSEWWGGPGTPEGHTVFRSLSDVGNGIVSVVAYPSSKPSAEHWPSVEKWLQERYASAQPQLAINAQFRVLGYQWRVLQFNDNTRQSAVKVMAAYRKSDTDFRSLFLMQQPSCLPVPYLKSMISAGFSTLASLHFDLLGAVCGNTPLHVLCIGHGGGVLPLFVASKIKGAIVHSVEIDPIVISASIQSMGFPSVAFKEAAQPPDSTDQVLWEGIHERLFLFKSDAEKFILENTTSYDLVFVDAYDGDDVFPRKLWDPDSPFLKALASRLHPDHGTVVVNLHADSDIFAPGETDSSHCQSTLPLGKYVSQVARAYKEQIGMAFTVPVPWLCNLSLIACRSGKGTPLSGNSDSILKILLSRSNFVESILDLPFPCVQYIKRDFVMVH